MFQQEIEKSATKDVDVSPKGLATFKALLTPEQIEKASSPKPKTVELTDILLDAWSMTTITEPTPGRPEVGPWLRGIEDELPQTTIAWRAELDEASFANLDLDDVEEWFDTHRILTHETLSAPTHDAAKWFIERWEKLPESLRSQIGSHHVIVDRGGNRRISLRQLIDQLKRKGADNTAVIRYADVILPASFGGIERGIGLLNTDAPAVPNDQSKLSNEDREQAAEARLVASDVADARGRYREIVVKNEDGDAEVRRLGSGVKPSIVARLSRFTLSMETEDDKRLQLVSYVSKQEKLDWGTKEQTLAEHVGLVRQRMDDLLNRLDLSDPIKIAARLAAKWHDHGKDRERWQRCAGRKDGVPALGKSGGAMKRDARGYRHEFGSLRELADAFKATELSDDVFDLTMHLIATHHGRGRPHFPKGGFDPDCERQSDEIHTAAIRRFGRLQRKYGWWHLAWLENLLRCADALASSDVNGENVTDNVNGGGP